jgi:lycopene cyclase domain-containing protein
VTYAVLTVVVLALVSAVCLPVLRGLPRRPLRWTAAALLALTAVFDSAIVGFGLTVYDTAKVLGVHVGAAPLEDFGYTLAALMIVPTLWTLLGRRRASRIARTTRDDEEVEA